MTKAAIDLHRNVATGQEYGDPAPARDLIDFHLRWREFRPYAIRVLDRDGLSAAETETLRALVDLADRVRDHDLLH
jgi:hypothetical protein